MTYKVNFNASLEFIKPFHLTMEQLQERLLDAILKHDDRGYLTGDLSSLTIQTDDASNILRSIEVSIPVLEPI